MNADTAVSKRRPILSSPLSKADLAPFCTRRDGLAACYCLGIVAGIVGTFALHYHFDSLVTLSLAFFLMGGFQHQLSVIHHEAVHYLLFQNRRLNELVGRYLGAYPVGLTMVYRQTHLAHHRFLGEEDDPDLPNYAGFPAKFRMILLALLKDLTGVSAVARLLSIHSRRTTDGPGHDGRRKSTERGELVRLAATQAVILIVFAATGHGYLYIVAWVGPLVTWTKMLTHLRNIIEHVDVCERSQSLPRWRTIRCNAIEAFFLGPMNFNYHAEHHLYPQVPFYHLPALHRRLMGDPHYRTQVEVCRGYVSFLFSRVWARGYKRRVAAHGVPGAGA